MYLDSKFSPTATCIQTVTQIMSSYGVNILGIERQHFCRTLLAKDEQVRLKPLFDEELEKKLSILFKITLAIAKKADINVSYNV
jgi:hypothetical protein